MPFVISPTVMTLRNRTSAGMSSMNAATLSEDVGFWSSEATQVSTRPVDPVFCIPATPAARSQAPLRCGLLRRRPAAPSRPLMRSAMGERPASILAGMPPAGPSPDGGSLRSRRTGFRLSFTP